MPMSSTERDYFHQRAVQEERAAEAASCNEARLAHEEMAVAYRFLCRAYKRNPDPPLGSERSAFSFNAGRAG